MIYSMTGYSSDTIEFRELEFNFELKSLNSKGFEFNFKAPSMFRKYELEFRSIVQNHLQRGKVELCINQNKNGNSFKQIDAKVFKEHYDFLKSLQESVGEKSDIFSFAVSQYSTLNHEIELENDEVASISKLVDKLCQDLMTYRVEEGKTIQVDFEESISIINKCKEEISEIEPIRIENKKERLKNAIEENVTSTEIDYNRLHQELMFYIEKYDISEEISRLNHHLAHFNSSIENENMLGKKLGFICQEIGREINTIGSKSNNIDIQNRVITMKDNLEKIKEQIGNVM